MRWLVLLTLLSACRTTTGGVRARAERLSAEAEQCRSFADFEAVLATEREALVREAPGEDLVPASQALSSARRRCALTTVDGLLERQQAKGRAAAVVEVAALTRALGPEETTRLLRERWGRDADSFLDEVALSGTSPGPTPPQPPPQTPTAPPGPAPTLPGDDAFGEGPNCLRRPTVEAASCLAEWRREGAPDVELDPALAALVARTQREAKLLDADGRAVLLGDVLKALALPQERSALAPLFADLARLTDALLRRAQALADRGQVERAAVLVRPLLVVDASRRRVEPLAAAASRKHALLASDARASGHAAQLHRHLAAWFLGTEAPLPTLEAGRWSDAHWGCELPRPALPPLPGGVAGRVSGRCRRLPKPEPAQPVDPSMRTFEFEASLPRLRIDADVSLTCGGKTSSKRLTADEVLVDPTETHLGGLRPSRLDGPLEAFVAEVERGCLADAKREASSDCARLGGEALEVTQTFTRHALRLGAWPACFATWFEGRYGVAPPALRLTATSGAPTGG